MKRLLVVFLVIVMALFCFTACTDNSAPPAGDTDSDGVAEVLPEEDKKPPEQEQEEEQTKPAEEDKKPEEERITKMYISINGNKAEVELAENSSVDALIELLKKDDIVYTADDYGGFEKVGSLGHPLPTENSQITTEAGDVILYAGNQIVLFYGSNSWSYTRLGKIKGYSVSELRTLLCAGKGRVQVTLSLK